MTARKTKTTPADVVPDAPTIAEHDAEAVATELEVRAAPGATLEATVVELEPFLAALGAPFTSCGRTADESVPAELADAWGRRYARAARIEE